MGSWNMMSYVKLGAGVQASAGADRRVAKARPPLRYHGGKWRLAPWIIARLPAHRTYVEVFGGAAGVLLRKGRSQVEVYNDLDSQVVNLFRILREPVLRDRLIDGVALTPYSREEFYQSYEVTADPVESARRLVLRCYLGHGTGDMNPEGSNGFRSCDIRAGKSYAQEWARIPDALRGAAERFIGVTIEHLDFRRLIRKFDDRATLFYVDPPYPKSTRNSHGKGYVHELSDGDHRELAEMLRACRGRVMLSGYPCALYDELYHDWPRVEKQVQANGRVGAVSRREVLWANFEMPGVKV